MNFKPLGDRVIVERKEEETKTASGLIIPDSAKEKPAEGTVIAMSKSVKKAGELEIGDVVCFGKYAGKDLTIDGKEYLVLEAGESTEIIGVYTK